MEKKKHFKMLYLKRDLMKALNETNPEHIFRAELNVSIDDIAEALAHANLSEAQLDAVCAEIKQRTIVHSYHQNEISDPERR